jgi:hypothetical protein
MPDTQQQKAVENRSRLGTKDEALLREIRENYDTDSDQFGTIREEGSKDILYVANDPWPDSEKTARRGQEGSGERPMISDDQLNQYCNLVINEVRQHPREIKISPAGFGATAQLAELRENRIRAIQYKSDAQAAYITALENCVQRSYGFARVSLRYASETSFDQEICIRRIPNPDAVLMDPGCKELDCSDAEHCFLLDEISKTEFRRRWPKAEIVAFEGEVARNYPQWIKQKFIQIAEYWRVEKQADELVQFDGGAAGLLTELKSKLEARGGRIENSMVIYPAIEGHPEIRAPYLNSRDTHTRKIWQYLTNGVEILEENEWVGKWIPIVPIWGKELFITEAGGSKRMLMSLIRNARDAQMAFNYARTCMMEAVGQVPRTNYLAIEGQFEGHEQEVAEANRVPRPYLYYKAVELPNGEKTAQPPTREPFDPPLQNLALAGETFQRDIQSAIGMYNSSVGKNDTNVKSGKAIQELDEQSDVGSFHFISNYNRFITAMGRIASDLISKVEVSERQVPIRMRDGKEKLVWINKPYTDEVGQKQHHDMTLGEYDVTIAVGPNEDSQREEASDYLETLTQELEGLPLDPSIKTALLALIIQLKQLGPIGDQMVKILQPPQGDPAQQQQQLQALQSQLTQLQTENAALHQDRAKRELEAQTKLQLKQMEIQAKGEADAASHTVQISEADKDRLVKLEVAEISTKAQDVNQRLQLFNDLLQQLHQQAHELGMAMQTHQHNMELGQQAAATQSAQQASDQVHQQAMQEQNQSQEGDQQ